MTDAEQLAEALTRARAVSAREEAEPAESEDASAHLRRAIDAQRTRADNAEARATVAETALSRYAEWAQRYDALAEEAAMGQRMTDLNFEMRRRIHALELQVSRLAAANASPTETAAPNGENA